MSLKIFRPHFPTRSLFRLSFINPFGESEKRPLFLHTFYSPVIIRSMFAKDPQKCRSIRKWFIFGLFPLRFVTNLRNDSIIHYSSGRVSLAIFPHDSLPFELDFSADGWGRALTGKWRLYQPFRESLSIKGVFISDFPSGWARLFNIWMNKFAFWLRGSGSGHKKRNNFSSEE